MENRARRWAARLDRFFMPFMGPAQVSPMETEPPVPSSERACPLCGAVMSTHTIVRPGGHAATRLICPRR